MSRHVEQCALCRAGVLDLDPELSNVAVGKSHGVSEASVRRHRKYLSNRVVLGEPESFLIDNEVDPADVTVRGYTKRHPDGSYSKVMWRPKAADLKGALAYDDLASLFDSPVGVPLPAEGDHAEVLNMADLQWGKVDAHGGSAETAKRVKVSLAAFAARVAKTRPSVIVVVDNGDPIENIFNTPSQVHTNDLDLVTQIRVARRSFAEAIRTVAPLAPEVVFVSVPSNHGQFRTGYKSAGGSTDADFGLEINHALEEVFLAREGFGHVRFVRPSKPLEETATLEVAGTKLAFHHGHHTGGPLKHGEWWARQDHGRRAGWDADILVMGHFHTFNIGHSGNGRWIISTSSSDGGSTWFTNKSGEESIAGMTAFSVRGGKWFNIEVL